MTKHTFFFSFIFCFCHTYDALAQKFSIGPLVGAQAYQVSFHHDEEKSLFNSKPKIGYRGGAYIEFPLENNFSWATEAYYSRKGRKISNKAGTITNNAAYNFAEVSVLLRKKYNLTLVPGIPAKAFFNIGPNVNYWINGKGTLDATVDLDYTVKFDETQSELTTNTINDANRWLFGLEAGAGVETRIYDKQFLQFEIRFTYGQTYLGDKDSSQIRILGFQDSLRSNYRVLSLVVRYGLDIDLHEAKKGKSTIKRKH